MIDKLLKNEKCIGSIILHSIYFLLLVLLFIIILLNIAKSDFQVISIFFLILLFSLSVILPISFFSSYQIFEFYTDKIIIRKPFYKRKNVQKGVNYWEVFHDEWDELVHFSVKNGSILYFRKEKTLVFIIIYSPIDNLGKKIFELYPRKKIYLNSDFNYSNELISELKVKFPERYSE